MGLDEALLESAEAPPTLRFYTWAPDGSQPGLLPALRRRARPAPRPRARRAAHHRRRRDPPRRASSPSRSPRRWPRRSTAARSATPTGACTRPSPSALAELRRRGAALRGERALALGSRGHRACASTTRRRSTWSGTGARASGSAQRRKGGRVLHHGSIKLGRRRARARHGRRRARRGRARRPRSYAPHLRSALSARSGCALSPTCRRAKSARGRGSSPRATSTPASCGGSRREPESLPGGPGPLRLHAARRAPSAERAPGHDRHAARRPPLLLRLRARDLAAPRRARRGGPALHARADAAREDHAGDGLALDRALPARPRRARPDARPSASVPAPAAGGAARARATRRARSSATTC